MGFDFLWKLEQTVETQKNDAINDVQSHYQIYILFAILLKPILSLLYKHVHINSMYHHIFNRRILNCNGPVCIHRRTAEENGIKHHADSSLSYNPLLLYLEKLNTSVNSVINILLKKLTNAN